MDGINISQIIINIISLSSFYACFAVGLALVFGVMKIINFAHGELYMLGGYTLWIIMTLGSNLPLPIVFFMALIIGPIAIGFIGIIIQKLIFKPLQKNPFGSFMSSLGLAYIFQVLAAKFFGVVDKSLPIIFRGSFEILGGFIPVQRFVLIIFASFMMASLWYLLMQTKTGRAIRATAQSKESALLQGINFSKISALAMGIGAALASISGSLMGSVINIGPYMGLEAIWKAFIIVIVGGLGSIGGAILAAIFFGFIDSITITFGLGQFAIMIDTIIMLIVLAFFPQGLLGREVPSLEQEGKINFDYQDNQRRISKSANISGIIIIFIIAILIPHILPKYLQDTLILFMINVILVVSYRLITTIGSWSFAHIATMGLGSFVMAMVTTKYFGFSFWLALPLGGLASAFFAFLISYPVLKTKEFYFLLSTFAAGEALRQCFIQFKKFFGGIEGISFIKRPASMFFINYNSMINYYYLVLLITILCCYILFKFDKSRIGKTVKAIAANENLSESIGINTWGFKALTFIIGSFFAGIAGVLFGNYNGFVAPTDYTTVFMFMIITSSIIGGTRTFYGPILGLIVITIFKEVFRDAYQIIPLIYGVCIIGIMLFMPQGIESKIIKIIIYFDCLIESFKKHIKILIKLI